MASLVEMSGRDWANAFAGMSNAKTIAAVKNARFFFTMILLYYFRAAELVITASKSPPSNKREAAKRLLPATGSGFTGYLSI